MKCRDFLMIVVTLSAAGCNTFAVHAGQSGASQPRGTVEAAQVFTPETNGHDVSINGVAIGLTGPMTWKWGDGAVTESWFPAAHTYARRGTYTVQVRGKINTDLGVKPFSRTVTVKTGAAPAK